MARLTEAERDRVVAEAIKAGSCPFGNLKPGQTMAHCPSGFPGCGCADELMENPFLKEPHEESTPKPESI